MRAAPPCVAAGCPSAAPEDEERGGGLAPVASFQALGGRAVRRCPAPSGNAAPVFSVSGSKRGKGHVSTAGGAGGGSPGRALGHKHHLLWPRGRDRPARRFQRRPRVPSARSRSSVGGLLRGAGRGAGCAPLQRRPCLPLPWLAPTDPRLAGGTRRSAFFKVTGSLMMVFGTRLSTLRWSRDGGSRRGAKASACSVPGGVELAELWWVMVG